MAVDRTTDAEAEARVRSYEASCSLAGPGVARSGEASWDGFAAAAGGWWKTADAGVEEAAPFGKGEEAIEYYS